MNDEPLVLDSLVALAGVGTPEAWDELCGRLEDLDAEAFDAVRSRLEQALDGMDPSMRRARRTWMAGLLADGDALPAFAVVRSVTVSDFDGPHDSQDWALRLGRAEELTSLRILKLECLELFREFCADRDTLHSSRYHYLLTEQRMSFKAARAFLLQEFRYLTPRTLLQMLTSGHGFPELRELDLSGNELGDGALQCLGEIEVGVLPKLETLIVRANALSARALETFLQTRLGSQLTQLDARSNGLSRADKTHLKSIGEPPSLRL